MPSSSERQRERSKRPREETTGEEGDDEEMDVVETNMVEVSIHYQAHTPLGLSFRCAGSRRGDGEGDSE